MRANCVFPLVLLACWAASGQPADDPSTADSAGIDTSGTDTSGTADRDVPPEDSVEVTRLYEYIANPILQMVTWPVETFMVPVVKGLIYPLQSPLRYFLNENVIDRTISLISFGRDDKVMLYPILNLAPGTGSFTGLTLRHRALFSRPTENLVAHGSMYVNGDWRFRTYLNALSLMDTRFDAKAGMTFTRVKNTFTNQPGTNAFWYFADTSNAFSLSLTHPVVEKFSLRGSYTLRDSHFGDAPPHTDSILSRFFFNSNDSIDLQMRGLNQDWTDQILGVSLLRDTRNNENIPLAGTSFNLNYVYHITNASHDFHSWAGVWNGYFKLGKEKYEISKEEERKAGGMSMRKLLKKMEYEKLKETLFNRKVLALRVYAAQSFELKGNHMPVYGLQTLGNDTPLRGYGGSRFRDYTVGAVSAEYRFPVMRLVDGDIFDEYGVIGRSWDEIDFPGSLKNSWGFGIRVRRPDIFLFRVQLGFHGYQGIQFNMSVDEPF